MVRLCCGSIAEIVAPREPAAVLPMLRSQAAVDALLHHRLWQVESLEGRLAHQ
jgi:hypothetical protein